MHICINERDFSGRNHNFHFRRFFSSRFEIVLSSSSSKGGLKVMWLKDLQRKVFKSLTCSYSGTSRNTKDFQQFHLIDSIQMGWPHSNSFNNTLQCSTISLEFMIMGQFIKQGDSDMRFVRNFTPPEFQAKTVTP